MTVTAVRSADPGPPPSAVSGGRGVAPRYTRNVVVTFVGSAFPALAALGTAPILAHSLAVDGRGQVAAAMGPYILATAVATFGVPEALTYSIARGGTMARHATLRSLGLLTVVGAVTTAILVLLSGWFGSGDLTTSRLIVLASLGVVPALWLGVLRGAAAGLHAFALVARERFLSSTARLAGIAVLAGLGELTPLTATVVMATAPVLGAVAYVSLPGRIRARGAPSRAADPQASMSTGFALRVWIGSISGIVLSRVDQSMLGPLAGTYELGLYVVAVTMSEIPLVINSAIREVAFATESSERSMERLTASARISAISCLAVAVLLAAGAPLALPFLFGAEFAPALVPTLILLAAVALGTPGSVAGAGLSARGRPGLRSVSLTIACVLNIALLVTLAPRYGAVGAAWATFVGNLVSSNLNIVFLRVTSGTPVTQFYGVRRRDLEVVARLARRLVARRRPHRPPRPELTPPPL